MCGSIGFDGERMWDAKRKKAMHMGPEIEQGLFLFSLEHFFLQQKQSTLLWDFSVIDVSLFSMSFLFISLELRAIYQ